jgi:hypothetical protein
MKQEIVLPKFKIPGQTNWLVRGLWIGGGLVVVLVGLVVFGLNQRKELELEQARKAQAEQAAAAAAAQTAAAAPAPRPARAASKPTLATKAPLSGAALASAKPGVVGKPRAGLTGKGKMKARARAGYTVRKKPTRASKVYPAKAARGGAKAKPGAKGGDAIDDILRGFK